MTILRKNFACLSLGMLVAFFVLKADFGHTAEWESVSGETHCTARHEASLTAMNGKLYLLGGRGIKPVEEYDPETNTWRQLSPTPIEFHHFQALAVDGRIAVIGAMTGGYPYEKPLEKIWYFDPAKDEWSEGPEIPEARRRGGAGVVFHENKIYLVCGITNGHWNGFVPWMDVLDLETGNWSELPDAPHARDHFQAAVIDGKIVAVGGRTTFGENNQVFDLTVPEVDVYDIATKEWKTLDSAIPTQRAGSITVARGDQVIVIGGESTSQGQAHNEVEALSLATGEWESLPSLLQGRHGTGVGFIDNILYIAAGCGRRGGNPELNTMEKLDWSLIED